MTKFKKLITIIFISFIFAGCATSTEEQFEQHINKGIKLLSQEKYDAALNQYNKAIKLKPEEPKPYELISMLYKNKGNKEEADKYFKLAKEKNNKKFDRLNVPQETIKPANKAPERKNAKQLLLEGKKAEAIEVLNKAIESHPGNDAYYLDLAEIYKKDDNFEEVINTYKKRIELNPDDSRNDLFYVLLARTFIENNNIEEALNNYLIILKQRPDEEKVFDQAISTCKEPEHYNLLLNIYKPIVNNAPEDKNNDLYYLFLGKIYDGLKNKDKAKEMYIKAKELNPDFSVIIEEQLKN